LEANPSIMRWICVILPNPKMDWETDKKKRAKREQKINKKKIT
jgi:hypothetical protein